MKPIEAVQVGDLVWAWDENAGRVVKRRVKRLFYRKSRSVVQVVFGGQATGEQIITATKQHPFWVEGRGWVPAGSLAPGDVLGSMERGRTLGVLRVIDAGQCADVFNFEVDGLHNYFVGRHGVLVHNESSLDSGDGPPVGRPVPAPSPATSPDGFFDQLGGPARAQTLRLASRVAIGASLLVAGNHLVEKYRGAYSEAVANAGALEANSQHTWSAPRYNLGVPELRLSPAYEPQIPVTSLRLPKPEFLAQYEQFRLARDAELAAEPLVLRHLSRFGEAPAKLVSGGFLGLFPEYCEMTSVRDFEVVESKIREQLRQGDWRGAQGLSHDAGIDLGRYNELADDAYLPKRESPYKLAARALFSDPQFQADLVDVGGRALTASSLGATPGLAGLNGKGIMERGRMIVSSAMWIGYGLSESLDIARHGVGGWSNARSYREVWQKSAWEMGQAAISNMASEHAGMLLPASGEGRWGTPVMQSLGKWGAGLVVSQGTLQGVNWLAHQYVDPKVQPFAGGTFPTVGKSAVTLGVGHILTNEAVLNSLTRGSVVPWEYRALAWGVGRFAGSEFSQYVSHP